MNNHLVESRCEEIFDYLNLYGSFQPATNFWRAIEINQILEAGLPGGQGLDLGCGDGIIMSYLLEKLGQRNVIGVDIDPEETQLASLKNIYSKVYTTAGGKLPLDDNAVDFVFSNSVLEHIPNIEGVVAEVARVLKQGGRFIFTVPNPHFHSNLNGPRFFHKERDLYLNMIDKRCAHVHYFSLEQWSAILGLNGLTITKEHSYLNKASTQKWEDLARFTSGILYTLMRGKQQPIDIQRKLQIRGNQSSSVKHLISKLSRFLACLEFDESGTDEIKSCYLIEATKEMSIEP